MSAALTKGTEHPPDEGNEGGSDYLSIFAIELPMLLLKTPDDAISKIVILLISLRKGLINGGETSHAQPIERLASLLRSWNEVHFVLADKLR
jgi:hypothetical protein